MKKRIALLAAATLVMSSLSGCASNSTAPETTATATTQAEKETTASDTHRQEIQVNGLRRSHLQMERHIRLVL